jgi:probable rRNA maturation factor
LFEIFYQVNKDLLKDISVDVNFEAILDEAIPKIENLLETEDKYFSIILTDDEFIKKMNNEYRNENCATDVISFPGSDETVEAVDYKDDLGEIYISIETAMRQAVSIGVSIEDEMKRLVVHGILHLMGFDHEKSLEDEEIMTERENFVLSQV